MMFFKKGLKRLTKTLEISLYVTLQRLMGQNSVTLSGELTLGIRVIKVWLSPSGTLPVLKGLLTREQSLPPTMSQFLLKKTGCTPSGPGALNSPMVSSTHLTSQSAMGTASLLTVCSSREAKDPRFKEMDPSISGRGAEPVYRDKIKGERISKDEFLKSQKGEEKPKEKKLEWGKGLAQKREAEARQQELELEKDKPFARTRDDPELDKMLKERVRWGDPMAHLVKKKHYEPILPDLGDSGKMKESGFIIPQDIPNHSWIKRGLDAAPNRYGIRPGRHWDGVDRSNGFEKGLFKKTNDKQATEWEAYLWSVSDM